VFGIVLYATLLASADYGNIEDPVGNAEFLVDNALVMYAWNLVIYVVFGVLLIVLGLALYDRLKDGSKALVQTAAVLGFIWAGLVIAAGMVANIGAWVVVDLHAADPTQAAAIWLSNHVTVEGIGGGNEIVGGLWVFLLSIAAVRGGGLPKLLGYFGLLVGFAGIVTVVPLLGEPGGMAFGLGTIVWFTWVGIVLLRGAPDSR
jgi:hypothetical protein